MGRGGKTVTSSKRTASSSSNVNSNKQASGHNKAVNGTVAGGDPRSDINANQPAVAVQGGTHPSNSALKAALPRHTHDTKPAKHSKGHLVKRRISTGDQQKPLACHLHLHEN